MYILWQFKIWTETQSLVVIMGLKIILYYNTYPPDDQSGECQKILTGGWRHPPAPPLKPPLAYLFYKSYLARSSRKAWLWLFYSPFLLPPKKKGRRKDEGILKIVILSHAFLHDHEATDLSDFLFLFKLEFSLIMCFFLLF